MYSMKCSECNCYHDAKGNKWRSVKTGEVFINHKEAKKAGFGITEVLLVCSMCAKFAKGTRRPSKQEIEKSKELKEKNLVPNIMMVSAVMLYVLFAVFSSMGKSSWNPSTIDAITYCQIGVENTMHNPSSADFDLPVRRQIKKYNESTYIGIVAGHFTGTNLYGGTVQQYYYCEVKFTRKSYTVTKLEIN